MANIGTLATIVTANTAPFEKAMRRTRTNIKSFATSVRNSMRTVGRALTSIPGLVGVGGVGGLIGWSVKLAAELEQVSLQFEVLLGKGADVRTFVDGLRKFADMTTFTQRQVFEASKNMLVFGFTAEEVNKNLQLFGDISVGNAERLNRLVWVMGQIRSKGKADTRDLYQIAENGIPIIDALGRALNRTKGEIFEMTSKGKIGLGEVLAALRPLNQEGGIFEDMLKRMSKTTAGRFTTFVDSLQRLGTGIGKAIIAGLDLNKLTEELTRLVGVYKQDIVRITIAGVELFRKAIETVPGVVNRQWQQTKGVSARLRDFYHTMRMDIARDFGDREGYIYHKRKREMAAGDYLSAQQAYEQSLRNTPGNRRLQESFRRDRQPDQLSIDARTAEQRRIEYEQLRVQKQMRDLLNNQYPELVIGTF